MPGGAALRPRVDVAVLIPLLVAGVVALPWLAYLAGARALPDDASPADPATLPETAIELLWVDLRGRGEPALPRLNPFSYFRATGRPGMLAAYQAARLLLEETPPRRSLSRVLAGAAATIWVTRHWTAREALATTLSRHDYGHGHRGLDEAARAYFAAAPGALGPDAMARLVAVIRSPASLDPWCHPDANAEAARALLARAGRTDDPGAARTTPVPDGACD